MCYDLVSSDEVLRGSIEVDHRLIPQDLSEAEELLLSSELGAAIERLDSLPESATSQFKENLAYRSS